MPKSPCTVFQDVTSDLFDLSILKCNFDPVQTLPCSWQKAFHHNIHYVGICIDQANQYTNRSNFSRIYATEHFPCVPWSFKCGIWGKWIQKTMAALLFQNDRQAMKEHCSFFLPTLLCTGIREGGGKCDVQRGRSDLGKWVCSGGKWLFT